MPPACDGISRGCVSEVPLGAIAFNRNYFIGGSSRGATVRERTNERTDAKANPARHRILS